MRTTGPKKKKKSPTHVPKWPSDTLRRMQHSPKHRRRIIRKKK